MATHCSSDYIYSIVDAHLHELGVESVTSREILDVVEGYAGDGLGSSAKEETGEGVGGELTVENLKMIHRDAL